MARPILRAAIVAPMLGAAAVAIGFLCGMLMALAFPPSALVVFSTFALVTAGVALLLGRASHRWF